MVDRTLASKPIPRRRDRLNIAAAGLPPVLDASRSAPRRSAQRPYKQIPCGCYACEMMLPVRYQDDFRTTTSTFVGVSSLATWMHLDPRRWTKVFDNSAFNRSVCGLATKDITGCCVLHVLTWSTATLARPLLSLLRRSYSAVTTSTGELFLAGMLESQVLEFGAQSISLDGQIWEGMSSYAQ